MSDFDEVMELIESLPRAELTSYATGVLWLRRVYDNPDDKSLFHIETEIESGNLVWINTVLLRDAEINLKRDGETFRFLDITVRPMLYDAQRQSTLAEVWKHDHVPT